MKPAKSSNHLKRSLTLLWLIPIVLISLILGTYFITQRSSDIEQAFHQNKLSIIQYIAAYSGHLFYTGDIGKLAEISDSVSNNENIKGAAFYNNNFTLINSTHDFSPPKINLETIVNTHTPETQIKINNQSLVYKPVVSLPLDIEDDFFTNHSTQEQLLGYVVLFTSETFLKEKQKNIIYKTLLICLIGISIAIALTIKLSKKIETALSNISNSIRELSRGNFDFKITEDNSGEMTELYTDINTLSDTLKNHNALMEYNIDIAVEKSKLALRTVEEKNIELSIQKEKAEKANLAKDEFLAKMSHELRTPVNAISGFAQLIRKKSKNPIDIEHAKIIINSSNVLLSIINELLDYSKIELGEYSLFENKFDLVQCLDHVYKINKKLAHNKKIPMIVDVDSNLHRFVIGDEYKLVQILNNILSNSIKFTAKGQINLKVSAQHQPNDTQLVQFIIADTGIGIPEQYMPSIFDPFMQIKNNMDTYNEGTGLGLSIVKKLLSLMHGTIEVSSKENTGTNIIINIPFAKHTSDEDKNPISINPEFDKLETKNPHLLKVLIAEDHDFNRLLLINILEDNQFQTYETKNGEELLGFLDTVNPDIVLLDMHMPIMNGYKVCEEIRSRDDHLKNIPIIIMTADVISMNYSDLQQVGANDIVYKPIDADELLQKILQHTQAEQSLLPGTANGVANSYTEAELFEEYQRLVDRAINQCATKSADINETLHLLKGISSLSNDDALASELKSLSNLHHEKLNQKLNELRSVIASRH